MTSDILEKPEARDEMPGPDGEPGGRGNGLQMSPSNATAAAGVAAGAMLTLLVPFPGVSVLGAMIGGLIGKKLGLAMTAPPEPAAPSDQR